MKKVRLLAAVVLMLTMAQFVSANMAAPWDADMGSAVTFAKNDQIAVLSEVLDIVIHGAVADITATYRMKNTTEQAVSTESMFVAPHMEDSSTTITANGTALDFTAETWHLEYDSTLETEDWRYVVLYPSYRTESYDFQSVCETVSFVLDFAPGEQYDVVVRYTYGLGGYPDYDFNVKYGTIDYYLTPAALWKDFQNLTINLTLDEDMPKLVESSIPFEKVGKYTYRYTADQLPDENLYIEVDENWIQNIGSTLRSPYLFFPLFWFAPIWIPVLIVAIVIIVVTVKKKRSKTNHE